MKSRSIVSLESAFTASGTMLLLLSAASMIPVRQNVVEAFSFPLNSPVRIAAAIGEKSMTTTDLGMVASTSTSSFSANFGFGGKSNELRIPDRKEVNERRRERQAQYEQLRLRQSMKNKRGTQSDAPSIWSFEALFPEPVVDGDAVYRDLYEVNDVATEVLKKRMGRKSGETANQQPMSKLLTEEAKLKDDGKVSTGRKREETLTTLATDAAVNTANVGPSTIDDLPRMLQEKEKAKAKAEANIEKSPMPSSAAEGLDDSSSRFKRIPASVGKVTDQKSSSTKSSVLTEQLSRMVEDRVYGMRRAGSGDAFYDTSLLERDSAVQFRDGVRLGKPLRVNLDLLSHSAKKHMRKNELDEAAELYRRSIDMDPSDGRGYLGLSRVAQRRQDFKSAREVLKVGIDRSYVISADGSMSKNPFLLQALGTLEERAGNLSAAEALFLAAVKACRSHAAAWVSLAQLRTRKLRRGPNAGRVCYQNAERELQEAGLPPSSYVYTAWAALEYKKVGDVKTARSLFQKALEVDPKCSAAWLQLGVMEADKNNFETSKKCFEAVLKFDGRNSRVLQAYAIMESKRPGGDSRKAIDLFERALRANRQDAGVLQAYALYVADLGDIDTARELLRRATRVNKRHAPVWQAWGVMETRHGSAEQARDIFQQGIWACAWSSGGQSGGRHCARLWQAWGMLEAKEKDYRAARRCFNRALDADGRNVAAVTAWAQMEEGLGNIEDARHIFERALKQFSLPASDDKMSLWRAYELLESRSGNTKQAQNVYQRYMRETITANDDSLAFSSSSFSSQSGSTASLDDNVAAPTEVQVVRWSNKNDVYLMGNGEIWMNNGSIESKIPEKAMKKVRTRTKRGGKRGFSDKWTSVEKII